MGDRLGTPGAVGFLPFRYHFQQNCWLQLRYNCFIFVQVWDVEWVMNFSWKYFTQSFKILFRRENAVQNRSHISACQSLSFLTGIFSSSSCQRPYHVEHTSSRPITEVEQHWARIVLRWETAWDLLVLLAFCLLDIIFIKIVDFNYAEIVIFLFYFEMLKKEWIFVENI